MSSPVNDPNYDPLQEYESTPALSFDPSKEGGIAENTWAELEVTDYIKIVQDKDDQGKPKFYEDSQKPVNKAVLPVIYQGEARGMWAKVNNVEGGLMKALRRAQTSLGDNQRIGPGTKLAVRWHWDTTKPKKLGNHPKAYEVTAKAGPAPAPKDDPLASSPVNSTVRTAPAGADDAPPF